MSIFRTSKNVPEEIGDNVQSERQNSPQGGIGQCTQLLSNPHRLTNKHFGI